MSEQDMSAQQGGPGMGSPGFGRGGEGQASPGPGTYTGNMGQAQGWPGMPGGGPGNMAMDPANAGYGAMGGPGMYRAPFMPPHMFQAPHHMGAHAMPYGWPPMPGYAPWMGPMAGQPAAGRQGLGQVMAEIANGGNGLSGLTKLLDLDDKDFWKGALVGAAAVLLLTNENVQRALFRGAVKGRDAVQEGVEKIKAGADKVKQAARDVKAKADE